VATTSAPEPRGGRPATAAAALSEQLFARHHRMVAGLCRALLRDPAEAEDAAQQAFLSAHRSLLNGAEPREPAAWLATIARNECWARIRGRMREPLATDAADTVVGGHDPVAEAIRRADLAALWAAIEALPRTQRDALLLREFGGLRYDELAAALAVSESAVESLLVRARTRLRSQLKAAYAAFTGASWLEWLARLAAGGTAPAAATKAVVVGLGAAAVTGGAVVGPRVVRHHQPPPPPAAATTTAAPTPTPTVAAVLAPVRAVRRPGAVAVPRHRGRDHEGDRRDEQRAAHARDHEPVHAETTGREGHGDGSPETTPIVAVEVDAGREGHRGDSETAPLVTADDTSGEGEDAGGGEGGGDGGDDGGSSGPGG
jgi:RNA polymerase sigma-70 factor (ECF subfamily)